MDWLREAAPQNEFVKQLLLNKIRLHYNFQVPQQSLRVESYKEPEQYLDHITTKVAFEFFGQEATNSETVEFEVYENWFQEFKDLYFPKWLLKRYPVRKKVLSKTVTMSVAGLLPDLVANTDQYVIPMWSIDNGRNPLY